MSAARIAIAAAMLISACSKQAGADEAPKLTSDQHDWSFFQSTVPDQYGVVCYYWTGSSALSCVKVREAQQ